MSLLSPTFVNQVPNYPRHLQSSDYPRSTFGQCIQQPGLPSREYTNNYDASYNIHNPQYRFPQRPETSINLANHVSEQLPNCGHQGFSSSARRVRRQSNHELALVLRTMQQTAGIIHSSQAISGFTSAMLGQLQYGLNENTKHDDDDHENK